MTYANLHEIVQYTSERVLPPRRVSPIEAAMQSLRNDKGAYDPDLSPMLTEPLNMLASREYTGIVFVGPARTGKTFGLILGGLTYIVTCAPGDSLIIQMSKETARDFSKLDLDKCLNYSSDMQSRLSSRPRDDNVYDKTFRNGVTLKIGWPAVTQLSSKTLQYVFITDYDRPENRENVDGEGPIWDLASKRIETYMSRGKCLAESSPGEEFNDPNWRQLTPHEAPPAPGILTLYNRGTRARWYWPCLECGELFQAKPGLELFRLPKDEELIELVKSIDPMDLAERYALVPCIKCGALHEMKHRREMNLKGFWLHDGQKIIQGQPSGAKRRTNVVSYWLGGVAATYQRWDGLLQKYFHALLEFTRNGTEVALKATTLTDQGMPYTSRRNKKRKGVEELKARSEKWKKGTIPDGVRFLIPAIDVQANRFVVQWMGYGVGLESWLIDRYNISMSRRKESETRYAAIDPAAYEEDWRVIVDEVLRKRYPLASNPDVMMGAHFTVCDSGGRDGVTTNAYRFWRWVRGQGMANLFQLIKGGNKPTDPRAARTYPDTRGRTDRKSEAVGDVPVWTLNVNVIKDGLSGDIGREDVGPGYLHTPLWADDDWFGELLVESRGDKGWVNPSGARNESWDLLVYARAACIILKAEAINWAKPPTWAMDPLEKLERKSKPSFDIGALARQLNE